jgi:hypothetical protein
MPRMKLGRRKASLPPANDTPGSAGADLFEFLAVTLAVFMEYARAPADPMTVE